MDIPNKRVMRIDYTDSLNDRDRTKNYTLTDVASDANIKNVGTLIKNVIRGDSNIYRVDTTNINDLT